MKNLLEVLNFAALAPGAVCMVLMVRYFCKESKRRGFHLFDWFSLPPSMTLSLALFVLISFVNMRLGSTVLWYLLGQNIIPIELLFLIAVCGIMIGFLCTIRALTYPDRGNAPWLVSMAATVGAIAAIWTFRH